MSEGRGASGSVAWPPDAKYLRAGTKGRTSKEKSHLATRGGEGADAGDGEEEREDGWGRQAHGTKVSILLKIAWMTLQR